MDCAVFIRFVFALLVALTALGCGVGGKGRPTKPVAVTVTYKGTPVTDATVTFMLEDAEPVAAFGKTDSSGLAKLNTPGVGDGVVLGKHKAIIIKEQIVNDRPAADQESAEYVPPPPGGAPVPQVKDLIPTKYKAPGTSPLTIEVSADGPAEFKLELAD
jgi:hypothetical protein